MTVETIQVAQGTDEWIAARVGKVTASRFSDVLAGGTGKVRNLYMRKLAGEIITGQQMWSYQNEDMVDGNRVEPDARALYSMLTDKDVEEVGFGILGKGARNGSNALVGRVGASPDGLISTDGMVELKRQAPHLLIERIYGGGESNTELHMAQSQGNLWVFEREWIDLAVYYPKMPMWRRRIKRDDNYINRLRLGVEVFVEELDQMVEKIKRYGQ